MCSCALVCCKSLKLPKLLKLPNAVGTHLSRIVQPYLVAKRVPLTNGQPKESFFSVTFTCDDETGAPLLAVAGLTGLIKILDLHTGQLIKVRRPRCQGFPENSVSHRSMPAARQCSLTHSSQLSLGPFHAVFRGPRQLRQRLESALRVPEPYPLGEQGTAPGVDAQSALPIRLTPLARSLSNRPSRFAASYYPPPPLATEAL
eukprot:7456128-Pyramimonas_sp.AAC.1